MASPNEKASTERKESGMDNKQKAAQELNMDQMEKVSGGVVWGSVQLAQNTDENMLCCPMCGKSFASSQRRERDHHMIYDCPNRPQITVIG